MKVLILDNYDSFTWNIVHGLEEAGGQCVVHRSDRLTLDDVRRIEPERIVISPGPFDPKRSGISLGVVREFAGRIPILGICLGMQVIATAAGAEVAPSGKPIHGKTSLVWHDGAGIFRGVANPFEAARYHSLIVAPSTIPPQLTISARGEDGTVLGCRGGQSGVDGVLFHPESFLTVCGPRIFSNFLWGQ